METNKQSSIIRIFVTGQHEIINQAIVSLLGQLPDFLVAASFFPQTTPATATILDLILLVFPEFDELTHRIRQLHQHHQIAKVVCFSFAWTPEQAINALQAGAIGCLETTISVGDLVSGLRQAAKGELTMPPNLQQAVVIKMARSRTSDNAPQGFDLLTPREKDVLVLLCDGLSNKQIAQRLYLSVRTIDNHLRHIYQKLAVNSRTEAAVLVMQQGWRDPSR